MTTVARNRLRPNGSLLLAGLLVIATMAIWFQLNRLNQQVADMQETQSHFNDHVHEHFNTVEGTPPSHGQPGAEQQQAAGSPHLHHQFSSNTHPQGNPTMLPQWSAACALALPLPASRSSEEAYLKLLLDLAAACLTHTQADLLVVIEQRDVNARSTLMRLFRERGLPINRLRLLEVVALDSIWLRDYGPLVTRDGATLAVVDPGYRDFRLALESIADRTQGRRGRLVIAAIPSIEIGRAHV